MLSVSFPVNSTSDLQTVRAFLTVLFLVSSTPDLQQIKEACLWELRRETLPLELDLVKRAMGLDVLQRHPQHQCPILLL